MKSLGNLTKEEIETVVEKMFPEFLAKEEIKRQRKKDFIQNNMALTMERIYHHLKRGKNISSEHMKYFPQEYTFSHEDFSLLFDIILDYANTDENKKTLSDEDCSFYNTYCIIKYRNIYIMMHIVCGQGTNCSMSITDIKNHKIKDVINFNEIFKKLVNNN